MCMCLSVFLSVRLKETVHVSKCLYMARDEVCKDSTGDKERIIIIIIIIIPYPYVPYYH